MNEKQLQELIARQRRFYASGVTKSYKYRQKTLASLKSAILRHEKELLEALKKIWEKANQKVICVKSA